MKVKFDWNKEETNLHLSSEEVAEILYALDFVGRQSLNPEQRKKSKAIYGNITQGMKEVDKSNRIYHRQDADKRLTMCMDRIHQGQNKFLWVTDDFRKVTCPGCIEAQGGIEHG